MFFKSVLSFFFIGFLLLLSLSVQAKDSSVHYQITWPEGWKISTSQQKDKGVNSYLVTATKSSKGSAMAIISVHEIPRTDNGKVDLKDELKVARSVLIKTLAHNGFKITKTEIKPVVLKELKGYETTITGSLPRLVIIQKISMCLSGKNVFSIGVIKLKDKMDKNTQEEIDKALDSLVFVK